MEIVINKGGRLLVNRLNNWIISFKKTKVFPKELSGNV